MPSTPPSLVNPLRMHVTENIPAHTLSNYNSFYSHLSITRDILIGVARTKPPPRARAHARTVSTPVFLLLCRWIVVNAFRPLSPALILLNHLLPLCAVQCSVEISKELVTNNLSGRNCFQRHLMCGGVREAVIVSATNNHPSPTTTRIPKTYAVKSRLCNPACISTLTESHHNIECETGLYD